MLGLEKIGRRWNKWFYGNERVEAAHARIHNRREWETLHEMLQSGTTQLSAEQLSGLNSREERNHQMVISLRH